MRTNTSTYEASHGKKPRGYGLWWFDVYYTHGASDGLRTHCTAGYMANARLEAVRKVRQELGAGCVINEVEVLP